MGWIKKNTRCRLPRSYIALSLPNPTKLSPVRIGCEKTSLTDLNVVSFVFYDVALRLLLSSVELGVPIKSECRIKENATLFALLCSRSLLGVRRWVPIIHNVWTTNKLDFFLSGILTSPAYELESYWGFFLLNYRTCNDVGVGNGPVRVLGLFSEKKSVLSDKSRILWSIPSWWRHYTKFLSFQFLKAGLLFQPPNGHLNDLSPFSYN